MKQDFDKLVDRKGTYCTQWDYIEDRFGKKGILPFSISDMDIACPKEIIQAISTRNQHPVYGYSRWKNDDYLNAIVNWYKKRFDCQINPTDICYSPSVMYSVSKFINLLSEEGEGVIIFTPAYDSFFKVIENNKRSCVWCELFDRDGYYEIDFDLLEECMKEAKILLLCNPHNPVGRMWKKEELQHILRLCDQYNISVISDEIHMDIDYQRKMQPILMFESSCKKVICTSPSKSFNTPSLGGSYIIAQDEELLKEFEKITRYTDYVNSPSILGVLSTIVAYDECENWIDELNEYLYGNICFANQYIQENMPLFRSRISEACYFVWIDFTMLNVEDCVMQDALINIGNVGIMSGVTYGAKCKLRFHVGCSKEKVIDGLQRLKKTYDMFVEGVEK